MGTSLLLHTAAWSAFLSAVFTILTFVTALLFFSKGGRFGIINDISSVLQVLFMLPLPVVLYNLLSGQAVALNLLMLVIGLSGLLVSGLGQVLLLMRKINFEQSMKFFPAGAALGLWLLSASVLASVDGLFSAGLLWTGIAAGIGYLLTVTGFLVGGQRNPLFYLGGLVAVLSYPVWAIWLGRLLT